MVGSMEGDDGVVLLSYRHPNFKFHSQFSDIIISIHSNIP